jgi:Dolichyl-phosphate-mannose-protein mannosyltransferase
MSRPDSVALSQGLTSLERKINAIANRVSDTLDEHRFVPYVLLTLFSLAYFTITRHHAVRKLFWYDELFTIYLSRLPDLGSLWTALRNGVDFNPPLIYPLTRLSEHLVGEGPLGVRVPAILGFWVLCLCLFRFVVVRSSVLGALISLLFPMVTMAYWYAYEARPHALVLAFCGISLVCWQRAAERTSGRFWSLFGMGAALFSALLTHSYAFLLFFPLAAGEFWRAAVNRKPDWPVWGTMALSASGVLVSLPLLHAARSYIGPNEFFLPTALTLAESYQSTLAPAVGILLGSLAFLLLARIPHQPTQSSRTPRPHELVALWALAGTPIVAYIVARLTSAPLLPRYTMVFVAGVACLLGFLAARRPVAAIAILVLLAAEIGISANTFRRDVAISEPSSMRLGWQGNRISTSLALFQERYQWIEASANKDVPVVVLNPIEFMPTSYYAPPDLVSRLTYVMWLDFDVNGENIARLIKCCQASVTRPVHSSEFLAAHDRFLVFAPTSWVSLLARFIPDGATVAIEKISGENFLASVSYPKKGATAAAGSIFDHQ